MLVTPRGWTSSTRRNDSLWLEQDLSNAATLSEFPFCHRFFHVHSGTRAPGAAVCARPRVRQGQLHEVRISNSDARRRSPFHGSVRSQGSVAALSDHALANTL